MGKVEFYRIETPESTAKIGTVDQVRGTTTHANFGDNPFKGDFWTNG